MLAGFFKSCQDSKGLDDLIHFKTNRLQTQSQNATAEANLRDLFWIDQDSSEWLEHPSRLAGIPAGSLQGLLRTVSIIWVTCQLG